MPKYKYRGPGSLVVYDGDKAIVVNPGDKVYLDDAPNDYFYCLEQTDRTTQQEAEYTDDEDVPLSD